MLLLNCSNFITYLPLHNSPNKKQLKQFSGKLVLNAESSENTKASSKLNHVALSIRKTIPKMAKRDKMTTSSKVRQKLWST